MNDIPQTTPFPRCIRCGGYVATRGKKRLCKSCYGRCKQCNSPTVPRANGYMPTICSECRKKARRKDFWHCKRCKCETPIGHQLCDGCRTSTRPCPRCGGKREPRDGTYCKPCWKIYWAALPKDPEKLRIRERRRTLRNHGLTLESFAAILEAQGGVCAGCGATESTAVLSNQYGQRGNLHVDHDHATQKVRGILCATCNNLVGRARDKPEVLRRLADYLESPPAMEVLKSSHLAP